MGPLTFRAPRWMWAASAGRSRLVVVISQQTSLLARSTVTAPRPVPSGSPWPRTPEAFTSLSPVRTAASGRPADSAADGRAAWAAPVPMRADATRLNMASPQTFVLLRTDTSSDWPAGDRWPIPGARAVVVGGFGRKWDVPDIHWLAARALARRGPPAGPPPGPWLRSPD